MKEIYTAYLVWALKNDLAARLAWDAVMGSPMIIKIPITDRWEHDQMIITNIMTDERAAKFKTLLGSRIKILDKPPLGWRGVRGMNYGG